MSDETGYISLTRRVDLELIDPLGWKEAVLRELDEMRNELPYADTLTLRFACERRSDADA